MSVLFVIDAERCVNANFARVGVKPAERLDRTLDGVCQDGTELDYLSERFDDPTYYNAQENGPESGVSFGLDFSKNFNSQYIPLLEEFFV